MIEGKKHLSIDEKNKLCQFLLANRGKGKPVHGKIKEAAELFGVHWKTVTNLWAAAQKQLNEGKPISILSGKLGVPIKKQKIFDLNKLKEISFQDRSTLRDLAKSMEVSTTTIIGWIKEGLIGSHSNAIKPLLNDANKFSRIEYCLSQLQIDMESNKLKFKDMRNVIHIDEKLFFITNVTRKCYKSPEEIDQYRSCKSKRYITKVMFLCAVGRPQYGSNGELLFDEKVGMFPFTEQVAAKRNSKNRPKGTLETKNVESITKNVTKECIINQVIPALKIKWPANASKHIIIQQDNAKPHISNNDADFRQIACSDGFNIELVCQPPNSPDTNVNDLGWFRAIQSLQYKKRAKIVDDQVNNVQVAFEELTAQSLNNLSLQQCCIKIMEVKGHNDYQLQHMGKDALILADALPDCLEVDEVLVRGMFDYLKDHENDFKSTQDLETLKDRLGMSN